MTINNPAAVRFSAKCAIFALTSDYKYPKMNYSSAFETLFLFFLFGGFALKYYLDCREIRCIRENRGKVPEAFAEKITLEAHQKAADYSIENVRFGELSRLVSLGLTLILTVGGLLQIIYLMTTGWLGNTILAQVVIILLIGFISGLIDLPFSWYQTFKIEAKYGFNTTTLARFIKDTLMSAALSIVLGVPIVSLILWLWNVSGPYWWVWAWAAYMLFNVIILWLYPAVIAPLFNKFSPLPDGELKDRLESLLSRIGFSSRGLYSMDASKRSAKGNAYMTGFGKNKRIVLFDTLMNKLTPEETEAVLAHELGHYKLNHIYKMLAFSCVFSLLFFWLLSVLADCQWFYEGLGVNLIQGASHGTALVLFSIAVPVFMFPLAPLSSYFSRKHEFEADAFAVKYSNGHALISALVKLFSDNASTLTPDPVYSAFYSSHPDAAIRIQAIEEAEKAKAASH